MRVALIILGALFVLPTLITSMLHLYSAAVVADFAMDMQSAKEGHDPLEGRLEVVNKSANQEAIYAYSALANYNSFHERRGVAIRTYVKLADLMEKGEVLPDPEFLDVFVAARAGGFAAEECARLKQTLAKQCEVRNAKAELENDGLVEVSMILRFVARDDWGVPEQTAKLAVRMIGKKLSDPDETVPIASSAKRRLTYYERVAKQCAALRRETGNCAVTYISVGEYIDKKRKLDSKMRGEVSFAFLEPVAG